MFPPWRSVCCTPGNQCPPPCKSLCSPLEISVLSAENHCVPPGNWKGNSTRSQQKAVGAVRSITPTHLPPPPPAEHAQVLGPLGASGRCLELGRPARVTEHRLEIRWPVCGCSYSPAGSGEGWGVLHRKAQDKPGGNGNKELKGGRVASAAVLWVRRVAANIPLTSCTAPGGWICRGGLALAVTQGL